MWFLDRGNAEVDDVMGAGVALAERFRRTDRVVVCFFGDATANRGPLHEAASFVGVKKPPMIFVCENDGWAVSVSARESTAVEDIATRAAARLSGTIRARLERNDDLSYVRREDGAGEAIGRTEKEA